jgi:ATP-dependent protease Clp ATPase subunit
MMDVMYEVPSNEDIKRVILPAGIIEHSAHPILLSESDLLKAS